MPDKANLLDPWFTTAEAATYMVLHERFVRRICAAAKIQRQRCGGRYRIRRSWCDEYLASSTDGPSNSTRGH